MTQNHTDKRPLIKEELKLLVPERVSTAYPLAHIARLSVNGNLSRPACGAPHAPSFYVLPYLHWLINKAAVCWQCATLVHHEMTRPSSNTGVN